MPGGADAPREHARGPPPARIGAALLAFGLMFAFAPIHVDDVDGSLYLVVARNLARSGELLHLHGLSALFPDFYEHPPGQFWFLGGVIWLLGEGAVPWASGLFGLGTLALVYALGRREGGERVAVASVLMLALCESFFRYQARPRLDGPLTFFFTASVFLIVTAGPRPRRWLLGGLAAGLGAMVKGPPALGAPVAGCLFLLVAEGRTALPPRRVLAALGAAALFPAAFLLYDHLALDGAWAEGYLGGQILASTTGARTDGHTEPLYLLRSLGTRFWPGLGFALLALLRVRDRRRLALLSWALFIPLGFELTARVYWHYNMPAYVPLAILAGLGVDDLVRRWPRLDRPKAAAWSLQVAGALALLAIPTRAAERLQRPCPFGPIPAEVTARVPQGGAVGLLPAGPTFGPANILAQDCDRDVAGPDQAWVVVHRSRWPLAGYREALAHGDWVLAERVQHSVGSPTAPARPPGGAPAPRARP